MNDMTTISFDVPSALASFMGGIQPQPPFERNAMLLYPYIQNMTISHGRAAELLGVNKLDLIAFYSKLGIPYIDISNEELDDELETYRKAREKS